MSSFDNLPPTIQKVSFAPADEVKIIDGDEKRIVLVHSKDLSNSDLDSLRENGKILRWAPVHTNLDFCNLEFDFLLVDLRIKEARVQLGKQDLTHFHLVLYTHWFQKEDNFTKELKGHVLTSLPKTWVSKADFVSQLLQEKISSPSVFKSFLRLVLACWRD